MDFNALSNFSGNLSDLFYNQGNGFQAPQSNQQFGSLADALNRSTDANSFGANMATAQFGLQGLGGLASLYFGNQNLKQSKKQFNFNRDLTNRNLANQAQLANYKVQDRARDRAHQSGLQGPEFEAAVAKYFANNRVNGAPI